MPKPVLYGSDISAPVRTVLLVAEAIGLDFDFKEVNFFTGEHKTEEFRKKNPIHTMPVLEDGETYICDSHAIATYLISKYAKDDSLYPKDLLVRAQIDHRLHFDSSVLFNRFINLAGRAVRNLGGINQDAKDPALEAFDFMEKFLESNEYLVGNSLTAADLCCVASFSTFQPILPVDPAKNPKLAAWFKRVASLPYYERANGIGVVKLHEVINKNLAEMSK